MARGLRKASRAKRLRNRPERFKPKPKAKHWSDINYEELLENTHGFYQQHARYQNPATYRFDPLAFNSARNVPGANVAEYINYELSQHQGIAFQSTDDGLEHMLMIIMEYAQLELNYMVQPAAQHHTRHVIERSAYTILREAQHRMLPTYRFSIDVSAHDERTFVVKLETAPESFREWRCIERYVYV